MSAFRQTLMRIAPHVPLLLSCGAFLLTCVFASYKLTESPAIWYDEGFHTVAAMHIASYGTQGLQIAPGEAVSTQYVTAGFPFLYPVALAYRLFGASVLSGRAVMAIFILLFVATAYALIRMLNDKSMAALTLLLLSSFPMLYGIGKSVLGEVPGLLYLMLSLIAIVYWERSHYSKKSWIFVGLAVGLCVVTKPIFLLLLGAVGLTYLVRFKKIPLMFPGVLLGAVAFLCPILLWGYLQFSHPISVHAVLSFYANPYEVADIAGNILRNLLGFFTQSTPLYCTVLMVVWAGALWLKRRAGEAISHAELVAFFFSGLVIAAYLRLPPWYRYLFPGIAVELVFFAPSLFRVYAFLREKFLRRLNARYAWCVPFAIVALLVGLQLYQTAKDSYVAQYYASHETADLSSALHALGSKASFFIYNVPEVAVLLPSQNYYQYLSTVGIEIGAQELSVLKNGSAEYVIADSGAYTADKAPFAAYHAYKTVGGYVILEKNEP